MLLLSFALHAGPDFSFIHQNLDHCSFDYPKRSRIIYCFLSIHSWRSVVQKWADLGQASKPCNANLPLSSILATIRVEFPALYKPIKPLSHTNSSTSPFTWGFVEVAIAGRSLLPQEALRCGATACASASAMILETSFLRPLPCGT